jgi:hypothetical protein
LELLGIDFCPILFLLILFEKGRGRGKGSNRGSFRISDLGTVIFGRIYLGYIYLLVKFSLLKT